MAEVLGKSNLFATCSYGHKNNREGGFCLFSMRNYGFCLKRNNFPSLKLESQALRSDFNGKTMVFLEKKSVIKRGVFQVPVKAQMQSGPIGRNKKWWEKGLQPNMKEVTSAQDLVDSLLKAGDKLVIVDFFSPGCGGCKSLHPKLCQLAEMNPEVQFLQVNYEEHKSMCHSLNVHVLPFFRFYRGSQGRLCSFSCTNATIKKFKDALAKHTPDRCSIGETKGLEEKELLALAANKDLSFDYTPKPVQPEPAPAAAAPAPAPEDKNTPKPVQPAPASGQEEIQGSTKQLASKSGTKLHLSMQEKTLIGAGR